MTRLKTGSLGRLSFEVESLEVESLGLLSLESLEVESLEGGSSSTSAVSG